MSQSQTPCWVMWEQVVDGSCHLWEARGLGSAVLLLQVSLLPLCDQQQDDPHSPRMEKAALERTGSFQNHLPSQTQQGDPPPRACSSHSGVNTQGYLRISL